MLRIILVRAGSTSFDEQGRIKGALEIPLTETGCDEARRVAEELQSYKIQMIYSAPCLASRQTTDWLGTTIDARTKSFEKMRNIDRGLWQGMRIEDLKRTNPRVFRHWQEAPETVCPPQGESLADFRKRLHDCVGRIIRKHRNKETIALVVPEPAASLIAEMLTGIEDTHLWQAECASGSWQSIEVEPRNWHPEIALTKAIS